MNNPIKNILEKRNFNIPVGIPSFCTANKIVIKAIFEYFLDSDEYVLIECTANQVNQFGGYTGMTPDDFVEYVYDIAKEVNFPPDRIFLGADHFGPLAWVDKSETEAMGNAKELVRQAVLAGYTKIHLDTSMFLGSDDTSKKLSDEIIAERGSILYKVCEDAFIERLKEFPNSIRPIYVIGSEVPIPGGDFEENTSLKVTDPNDFENTISAYDEKFKEYGIDNAWSNVIAIVVQPGVEFSNENIHDYDRNESKELCAKLVEYPSLVFEGHSTDYQFSEKLREMVEDGVAILKVGPALTFALREGLFALSLIEKELIKDERQRANFIEFLDETMLKNPKDWKKYYLGDNLEKELQRKYSFSDRSRYYLSRKDINSCLESLFKNINSHDLPLGLIKQYGPNVYFKIRNGEISNNAENFVKSYIFDVLDDYAYATKNDI